MIQFLIAPDFPPQYFAGWHLLNTRLHRQTHTAIHLQTPASAQEEQALIASGTVDIIYANPFDAAQLVRDMGYLPLVRPVNKPDEMVIATAAKQPLQTLADIKPDMRVLHTENRDVKLIGLRLLEAVDLNEDNLQWLEVDAFQAVARHLIDGDAEVGFFLASAYQGLSSLTLNQLHTLMESKITDISHVLLLHPRHSAQQAQLRRAFLEMGNDVAGKMVLEDLGLPEGFETLTQEDAEFMIDLMETLLD